MKQVIDRESARAEMRGWYEHFGEPVDDEVEQMIDGSMTLRAVMQGRIVFDDDAETFAYSLIHPIEKENGETVDTISLEEPTAEHRFRKQTMRVKAQKGSGVGELEMNEVGRFMSAASGMSVNMLRRLRNRDYVVLDELCGFFG